MQRQTPMDTSLRGYVSGGARGLVHEADDKQQMQELKINFLRNETREKVEHPQNYGFTSYCREADFDGGGEDQEEGNIAGKEEKKIKKSAEHFAQFMGGARNFPVVQNLDDRRFRCRNMDEGEVCVYDDQQQKVHLMRKKIYSRSPFKIEHRVIKEEKEEDGHGHDPKASRDQKKDESIRLSTVVMDKDWIVLERTKEKKGQQKQQKQQKQGPGDDDDYQNDEPEDEYKKDPEVDRYTRIEMGEKNITMTVFRENRPFLIFDMNEETSMIQMQTLREDQPNLQFTLDGENGEVSIGSVPQEGKPNLNFEMDDERRRIRINTEKDDEPHLIFELDARNETSTWKTEYKGKERLKIELDDRQETITLTTDSNTRMQFNNKEKKIELNTDNTRIEMDENQQKITMRGGKEMLLSGDSAYIKLDDAMARIGDQNANIPAAMRGSIDTMGNRLIGALAKKVMVV